MIRLSLALGFGAALLCALPAAAQSQREIPPIRFHISVVHASHEGNTIEPACAAINRRLGPMRFESMRMRARRQMDVVFGERAGLKLPSGHSIELLPVQVHGRRLHMQVEMPGKMSTRMQMVHGKPVILGGLPHEDGWLIVEIVPEFAAYLGGQPSSTDPGPRRYQINSGPTR